MRTAARDGFDYVVMGDRHSIGAPSKIRKNRLSHAVYETRRALERGRKLFRTGKGSIGMAMRAKTPIFDNEGNVIGVVSVAIWSVKSTRRLDFFSTDGGVLSCCWW
ncbi:hypothetical protein KCP78_01735 [Salmonella enterica subsp. enterica]|nr:hypothetical protein KCP78_01735 [Salmonella enterica subsp. enterica]